MHRDTGVMDDGTKTTCLEMQDDVPDEIKNNRRDAIGNGRGVDAKQPHLKTGSRALWLQAFPDLNNISVFNDLTHSRVDR